VFIETYGCSFNVSDSEVMAGLLERDGFALADAPAEADCVIINSCTVKDRTYLELQKRVADLTGRRCDAAQTAPAVVLAGCAPRVPQQSKQFAHLPQVGPDNLAAVPSVVRAALAGETPTVLSRTHNEERLTLPTRRRNPAIEIVPISKGCLGSCSFCQTVLARGRLRSFPEEQILQRIEAAVREGVRHVWLTSQDCGAYGLDCGTNLPRLMRRIARLPGDFRVRVGMANPDLIKLFLPEFVEALQHPRFYQFAHIPVQAGSDAVLAAMRRMYSVDDYRRICEALVEAMPQITLATDIIVGFPTEGDADFAATCNLVRDLRLPVVNRSKFSARVGTSAARLKPLPSRDVAERSRALYEIARHVNRAHLDSWVGWRGEAWVEEAAGDGRVLARNLAYLPISIDVHGQDARSTVELTSCGGTAHPGDAISVEMERVDGFHLCASALALAPA